MIYIAIISFFSVVLGMEGDGRKGQADELRCVPEFPSLVPARLSDPEALRLAFAVERTALAIRG
jgi:hypothetical protein